MVQLATNALLSKAEARYAVRSTGILPVGPAGVSPAEKENVW
jgi:hypothetical protein